MLKLFCKKGELFSHCIIRSEKKVAAVCNKKVYLETEPWPQKASSYIIIKLY